ncbi:MAG: PilZ domain-containing protein [Pseudomonadota bacterium]
MERRRQARTPVNINALVIGEKTVPKGCRVMNVSQNGMQLQCHADGRLLTFKEGDSVDVHLTIQHEGKQKKLTIPSWVRHVAANTIDVEFHKPDPPLVDLIETYRASEQHKLEAALGRLDRRVAGNKTGTGVAGVEQSPAAKQVPKQNSRPFYAVVLATLFAVCVITGGYVYTASIDSRITTLETISERQANELSELQNRVFSASLQEGRYASLNARMTAIVDAILGLEERLGPGRTGTITTPLHERLQKAGNPFADQATVKSATPAGKPAPDVQTAAIGSTQTPAAQSAPATGSGAVATPEPAARPVTAQPGSQATRSDRPVQPKAQAEVPAVKADAVPPTAAAKTSTDNNTPAPVEKSAPSPDAPWVINLISSTDKAYVERFSKESGAAARFNTELNSASVNGRQYWRLQITGFASAAEAKSQAGAVKTALGLKDVWIFRQK